MLTWLAEATQARGTFTGVPTGIHMSLETVAGPKKLVCAQIVELALVVPSINLQPGIWRTVTCVL